MTHTHTILYAIDKKDICISFYKFFTKRRNIAVSFFFTKKNAYTFSILMQIYSDKIVLQYLSFSYKII